MLREQSVTPTAPEIQRAKAKVQRPAQGHLRGRGGAEHTVHVVIEAVTFQLQGSLSLSNHPVTITCQMEKSAPQSRSLPLHSAPHLIMFSL